MYISKRICQLIHQQVSDDKQQYLPQSLSNKTYLLKLKAYWSYFYLIPTLHQNNAIIVFQSRASVVLPQVCN